MHYMPAGGRRMPYVIGVGAGLAAGLVGMVQCVWTARDAAARWAVVRSDPDFFDRAQIVAAYQRLWLATTAGAAVVVLMVYLLAACAASALSSRREDGLRAAWVAAGLSGVISAVASWVALATSPAQGIVQGIVPCEPALGAAVLGALVPVAYMGASAGGRARGVFSRTRRRAVCT